MKGLIPRHRLRWIPRPVRLAHEYCYFLHDACVRMVVEYQEAEAHLVQFQFHNETEAIEFEAVAENKSPIEGLRAIGRLDEARRVILNTITVAMVSDCMHHIFEALRCMERRKFIVALNLLRKPLLDSLIHLSWMLGDESGFYEAFTTRSPKALAAKSIGNHRPAIFSSALSSTEIADTVTANWLNSALFNRANKRGLHWLFQRSVHLITAERIEFVTEVQNFNFIFKHYSDDDVYISVYDTLPRVMLYLTHVITELFNRMQAMDKASKMAFTVRSKYGLHLVEQSEEVTQIYQMLSILSEHIACAACKTPPTFTFHNAARIVLAESFRCTACQRLSPFPFAWLAEHWYETIHAKISSPAAGDFP